MIGNKEKINECKWSIGEGTLLATCSDDHAVKVNYYSNTFFTVHVFIFGSRFGRKNTYIKNYFFTNLQ
jgi:hypothetical protein